MQALVKRIGGGGIAAILAVILALSLIGYRFWQDKAPSDAVEAVVSGDPLAVLEQRSLDEPENVLVWQELGFSYFDSGRFDDAARAFDQATQLSGEDANMWSSLGEALVMAVTDSRTDLIPQQALDAFNKAIAIDPDDPRARYFLAIKQDLDEDHEGAIASLLALLEDTPTNAPWATDLQRTIEQIAAINNIAVDDRLLASQGEQPAAVGGSGLDVTAGEAAAMQAIPGPTAEQMAAASSVRPAEQDAMVADMVASLAARLETEPNDVNGWIMLMRSFATLGQMDDAQTALGKAVTANPAQADQLRDAAASLGIAG